MRYFLITLVALLAANCNKPVTENLGSSLSDLIFTLPEGAGTLYTGYSVSFARHGAFVNDDKCSADKSWAKDTTSRNVTISHQVKNGCDYLIVLELGKVNAAKTGLEAVYYTNRNTEPGTIVKASQLTGGDVNITIKVFKTQNAPPNAPGELLTQEYSNLQIDVTFDTGDNSGNTAPPGRRAPQPPGGQQPNQPEALTAYEQALQQITLQPHGGGAPQKLWDKVGSKEIFLVKFSWVDCGPCQALKRQMESDQQLQAIKDSDKCTMLTVILPGNSAPPPAGSYQDPVGVGAKLKTNFAGSYPFLAVINRKTGPVAQATGGSPLTQFKALCQ